MTARPAEVISIVPHLPSTTDSTEDHSSKTTTEEQRIRVEDFTPGYDTFARHTKRYARSSLIGARYFIWEVVWEQTIGWKNKRDWDAIAISKFQDETPYGERGIQKALNWMVDNNWLERRNTKGQMNEYRIHPDRLIDGKYFEYLAWREALEEDAQDPRTQFTPPPNSVHPPIKGLNQEEEKIPPIPPNVDSTGNSQKHARENGRMIASLSDEEIEEISEKHKDQYDPNQVRLGLMKMRKCGMKKGIKFIMSYYFDEVYEVIDDIYKRSNTSTGGGIKSPGGLMVSEIRSRCAKLDLDEMNVEWSPNN